MEKRISKLPESDPTHSYRAGQTYQKPDNYIKTLFSMLTLEEKIEKLTFLYPQSDSVQDLHKFKEYSYTVFNPL